MGLSMLWLVWEKIKEAILCLPLFMFIIYYKRVLRFLAILGIVWETFLKNRNCCSQLPVSLSCLSQYSGHLAHQNTGARLALLNIVNSFYRIPFLSRKKWNKSKPFFQELEALCDWNLNICSQN